MPVPNPDHLLDQADQLINVVGGGAPRQVDLRRAISNAYYAAFHAVATETADILVGQTHRATPRYALAYRRIEHKALKQLCDDVQKSTMPGKYTAYEPAGGFGVDLVQFATHVSELQEKRHAADYDPLLRLRTLDARLTIDQAREALRRLRRATRSTPDELKVFVSLLSFPPR